MKGAIPADVGRVDDMAREIREVLEEHGVADEPVGLDIGEYALVQALEEEGLDLVDGQQAILDARMIKTDEEVELLRTAGAMVDAAYDVVTRHLRPGVTENELVSKVNEALYEMGSERVSCVNCVSGPRGAPHPHTMSDRRIRPNELVFLDIMHSFNGYQTCYYRTFSCGEPTEAQVEAYDTAWEWLERAIDAVEPGVTSAEVARQFPTAEEFGFPNEEDAFLLQVGHGIGLGLWEKPVISRLFSEENPFEIREGMTFALETWCPVEDGEGAARIEEEIVVTEDGSERLFKYPADELIACGMPGTETF
jgi:Xaa-Pro dipeptidase